MSWQQIYRTTGRTLFLSLILFVSVSLAKKEKYNIGPKVYLVVPLHTYDPARLKPGDIEKLPLRYLEVEEAMIGNMDNPYFEELHIVATLSDEEGDPEDLLQPASFDQLEGYGFNLPSRARSSPNVKLLLAPHRPSYKQLFDYASATFPAGSISVVSNNDIMWTQSAKFLKIIGPKDLYALSRHDVHEEFPLSYQGCDLGENSQARDMCTGYSGSHDSFAFMVPTSLPQATLQYFSKFSPGTWQAEPTLIALFRAAGYSVRNPCLDIRNFHFHCSMVRTYNPDEVTTVDPTKIIKSSAIELIGGDEILSQQLGETYVKALHGYAPPATLLDVCMERPGCWKQVTTFGYGSTFRNLTVSRFTRLDNKADP